MSGRVAAGVGVGVGVGCLLAWWVWRRRTYPETPNKWEEVGEVGDLIIYPLKSGRGVKVTEAEATRYGLAVDTLEDRSFMVTSDGSRLQGRFRHKMFGVSLTLDGSMVTLQAREEEEEVHFDLQDVIRAGKVIESNYRYGKDLRKGYDCGDNASAWLTRVIQLKKGKARLMYNGDLTQNEKPDIYSRSVMSSFGKPEYTYPQFKPTDRIAYAEHAAYMLASETSMADLNSRLFQPVTLDWFRPNIVVKGVAQAYDEDDWAFVRIGDVVLRRLKPCTKYVFRYMNPETGVKSTDEQDERLRKILLSTRKQKVPKNGPLEYHFSREPVFGSHLGIDVCGRIRVGDKIEIARASSNPRWQFN